MPSIILRRSSSSNIHKSLLDTALVVALSLLCFLLLAVGILHCFLRQRQRNREISRAWTGSPALEITPQEIPFTSDGGDLRPYNINGMTSPPYDDLKAIEKNNSSFESTQEDKAWPLKSEGIVVPILHVYIHSRT
ncbi:hypothetical protein BDN70DRAFT_873911 [Pholiota conissans]|uniref:Uncharacterized protein n=1 Tax=Pholiota conissans TaxID=109636 RepID=A0A9P6D4T5_9AGAR|nr:hypothetical protein BDN70DRAFT_873911 [Pholiota conissans]